MTGIIKLDKPKFHDKLCVGCRHYSNGDDQVTRCFNLENYGQAIDDIDTCTCEYWERTMDRCAYRLGRVYFMLSEYERQLAMKYIEQQFEGVPIEEIAIENEVRKG